LSTADWGVVIRQSEKEALAPAARLRQSLIFSGAGLVTVGLIFVIVTTRDVGTRIGTLTNASRRIAEGDLTSPVARLGHDEVGTLASTLDEMRVRLRSSYSDLEQKTRELSSLLSVSEILTSTADLTPLLNSVLAKAVEVVPGADGGILLFKPEHDDTCPCMCQRNRAAGSRAPRSSQLQRGNLRDRAGRSRRAQTGKRSPPGILSPLVGAPGQAATSLRKYQAGTAGSGVW